MKVAISLPDTIFEAAETLARELNKPRSQLYAEAIAEYLGKYADSAITRQLNDLYARESSSVDDALQAAQLETLSDETW